MNTPSRVDDMRRASRPNLANWFLIYLRAAHASKVNRKVISVQFSCKLVFALKLISCQRGKISVTQICARLTMQTSPFHVNTPLSPSCVPQHIRDLKIYDATTRRRVIKSKQIFIEDNNYE